MSCARLPPEYETALVKFYDIVTSKLTPRKRISKTILTEGNAQILEKSFTSKMIPSEAHWRWNQTKSRKRVLFDSGYDVEFFKLTPRKRSSKNPPLPSLKLWQYNVSIQNTTFYVLWCQVGLYPNSCASSDNSLLIDDYSFLAPFMEDHLLREELWPGFDVSTTEKK